MKNLLIMSFFVLFLLSGCSSTGIVPMDNGLFMIGIRDAQVGFGPPIGAKADAYEEANRFCAKESKSVKTIDIKETNSGFGRPASVELVFACE